MLKKLGLGLFALAISASGALAGAFDGYPIVGDTTGLTKCLSFGNGGVCNQFSPAGPADVAGTALIPADTGAAAGQLPTTVLIPVTMIGAGATQFSAPLTGTSITVAATTSRVVLDPAGTIAALTLVLPASTALTNGQILEIGSSQTVTALTITAGSGTTIAQNPTAITVSTTVPYGYKFVYVTSVAKWIRMQ